MRDNALVAALRKIGHDALMIPLYTPLTTDEPDNSESRIFFGGLNVYLQQKSPLFRMTPGWLDRPLDSRGLIKFATGFGIKTNPEDVGDLMISMLKGEHGNQGKELEKLCVWLKDHSNAGVICLSNVLLSGMAPRLKAELNIPIVCTLQGEDFFLDGLPGKLREEAWGLVRECAKSIDAFIPVSQYYGNIMAQRLELPEERVHAVMNGIELAGYAEASAPPTAPRIGYLSRIAPEKGLMTLVAAFQQIRARGNVPNVELHIAGSLTPTDKPFFEKVETALRDAGAQVKFFPNLNRENKVSFLQSLSVLSVPAAYGESFGLYVLEALACGVPVVQPLHGAFPELLAVTGGGELYKPDDPGDLALKIEALLLDEPRRKALGTGGRQKVLAHFTIERVAREVAAVLQSVTGAKKSGSN